MNEKQFIVDTRKEVIEDVRRRRLSTNFVMLCDEVLNHYERQYFQIHNQFKRVLEKYSFQKLQERKLIDDEEYVHVSLSLEQSCKDTYVCLDKGGGIHCKFRRI